jgi:aspartate/methionine/tyrosine aminotransferase
MSERTILIGGVAKSYAMTGWRVGWTIAPIPIAEAMGELAKIMLHGMPGFVQEGAVAALLHADEAIIDMRDTCHRRADIVLAALAECPTMRCIAPEAGMFVVADISRSSLAASAFARRLWHATGVAVMDGGAFGGSLKHCVRISLAVDDPTLQEACHRMAMFSNSPLST